MTDLEKINIKAVISDGYIVMYKNISVCDLKDHVDFIAKRGTSLYQVHSDNTKYRCSDVYKNIDEAINRFEEVKKAVK